MSVVRGDGARAGENGDPDLIETAAQFSQALQARRDWSGLTIREVARRADGRVATVGDYFSGRHLPLDRQLLARILGALGVTDEALVERWQRALARVRRQPGRRGAAPYRGLAPFEASDAGLFFGRDDVTRLLWTTAAVPSGLPLLLIGPSGAGKSSVLRAGLAPRLAGSSGTAPAVYDLTVTGVAALADAVLRLGGALGAAPGADPSADGAGRAQPAALIVDQFEAVFTAAGEPERSRLIGALTQLAQSRLVVLALRADFYGQAVRYPGLRRALQERQVVLGPMTAGQVRDAVVRPARAAQSDVDEGLVALLLSDLAPAGETGDAACEPGALPLLSHALLATWERSRGQTLTVHDYLASGGIRDALTRTAERAYESLAGPQRALARSLFLRLVHVSDEMAPSRASVDLSDLPGVAAGGDAAGVLATFVGERMITVDADAARITHDALLTAWPRLRSWVADDTGRLRERGQLAAAAQAGAAAGQEEAALWRGSRLAVAREWAGDAARRALLPAQALAFADASVAAAEAGERAARRRTRRLQATVAVLAALVLAVAGLSGYAFSQRSAARAAERQALTAASAANSRDVAFAADRLRGTDPGTAAQLSVSAAAFARTPQSTASLLAASGAPSVARIVDSAAIVQWAALSPSRRLLAATGDDGTLRLWDVARPAHPVLVSDLVRADPARPLYQAAFSPDGKLLAVGGAGGFVGLWAVDGARVARAATLSAGAATTVFSVAFSPDGATLAAGGGDGTVRLWHVGGPGGPGADGRPLRTAGTYPHSVAFSPDGQILAAGTNAGTVLLWRLPGAARTASVRLAAGAAPVPTGRPLRGPAAAVSGVAFGPGGHELAASSQDRKVWLWRVAGDRVVPDGTLTGATNWVNTVAFSPDGRSVAAGISAASVLVWSRATRQVTAKMPRPLPVTSVTWDGASRLIAAGAGGTVSMWSLPAAVLETGYAPTQLSYRPDGRALAVSGDGMVQLWATATRTVLARRALPAAADYANAIAFRPGPAGPPLIALAVSDGTVELLDGRTLAPLARPLTVSAGDGGAESVAFSPDGRTLATGADDGTVRLFDVTVPARPRPLAVVRDARRPASVYTVTFSPDGALLAAASLNNAVQLWRVSPGPGLAAAGLAPAGPDLGRMASYPIGLAFAPDSRTLAIGDADKHLYLWNVADPARARPLATLSGPSSDVWSVAFSPDGATLAAGVNDGRVWLWHMAGSARPVLTATLSGLPGHIFSVAYAPDGTQLAAASFDDDTVRLWDTSPAAARAAVCANLGQPLTPAEWATYVPGVPYQRPCG